VILEDISRVSTAKNSRMDRRISIERETRSFMRAEMGGGRKTKRGCK
jgi:hypothetical protein